MLLYGSSWYHRGMQTSIHMSACINHNINLSSHLGKDRSTDTLFHRQVTTTTERKTRMLPQQQRGWRYLTFIHAAVSLAPWGICLGLMVPHKAAGLCPELIKPQNRWFLGDFRNLSRQVLLSKSANVASPFPLCTTYVKLYLLVTITNLQDLRRSAARTLSTLC